VSAAFSGTAALHPNSNEPAAASKIMDIRDDVGNFMALSFGR
jgi:hypothetical protein